MRLFRNVFLILLVFMITLMARAQDRHTTDKVYIGKKTSTNSKTIYFEDGSGTPGEIGYNATNNRMEFKNPGGTAKAIGAGEGGASGGILSLDNVGFEDGITTFWTSSGDVSELVSTGCTLGTNCPLEGLKSLRFSPNLQNDYFESSVKAIPEILYGAACEISFNYLGGDTNLTAQVVDGDATVVASKALTAHATAGPDSLGFLCPNKATVVADNDKGNLKLKIINAGATPAAASDWDAMYKGSLANLKSAVLPDLLTAKVSSADAVSDENVDWINGNCTNAGTGLITCTFNSGIFTNSPNCVVSVRDATDGQIASMTAISSSAVTIATTLDTGTLADLAIHLHCAKAGSDALQALQVYTSIPVAAQNENNLSASIGSTGTVTSENTDFISGNCTNPGTGNYVCTYSTTFTVAPTVVCTVNSNADTYNCETTALSTTTFEVLIQDDTGTASSRAFSVHVTKQGADYKLPSVQPILVNQVQTKFERGIRTEICQVLNPSGTATVDTDSGLCAGWVSSVNRTTAGQVTVNFVSGVFSAEPVCTCAMSFPSAGDNNFCCSIASYTSTTSIVVGSTACGAGLTDKSFSISCKGAR